MGRVRICVGGYAKSPYVIRQAGVRLYAVEELCYYLEHYAVLLDDDMMNEELFTWIEEELELGDLARVLRVYRQNCNPLESFVVRIMEECHYCGKDRMEEIARIMRENAGLDPGEKKKIRIDQLARDGRYERALAQYRSLLADIEGKDIALTAAVYHAMGCIEAQMFGFALAEEYFDKAYRLTYHRESLRNYVCAVKMHGTRQEQEKKLAATPELRQLSELVDAQLAEYREQWKMSEACAKLVDLEQAWEEREPDYYTQIDQTVADLKEAYRKRCE
jgi:tetratricopeptide (TPR) repeat protein